MIITTINVLKNNNGGTERVKNLLTAFNDNEVIILTLFSTKKIIKSGIHYSFVGISFYDFLNILKLFFFDKLPLSVCLFQRHKIKFTNKRVVFHLVRSFQYCLINTSLFKNNFILDYCESHSSNLHKRINSFSQIKRFFLSIEIKRLDYYENRVLQKFSNTYFITKNDIKYSFEKHNLLTNKISLIGNYLPLDRRNQKKLCFIGDMRYMPNILAIDWIDKLLLFSNFKVHVFGKYRSLPNLKNKASFIFHGYVTDLDPIINDSFAAVFFSKESTGLQNKILDYLNHGIPIFTNIEVASSFIEGHSFVIIKSHDDVIYELENLRNSETRYNNLVIEGIEYLKKYYIK
jgi:hypothetical protein